MPVNGHLLWQELLDEISRRMGEIDVATNIYSSGVPGQANVPYNLRSDVEQTLYEVSNACLRELSFDEVMNIGTRAVTPATGASPVTMPQNSIGLISSIIDNGPTTEVTPSMFFQGSTRIACNMFAQEKVFFTGTNGLFEFVTEPLLIQWRNNNVILPPAYDNERIDQVCHILEVGDYLPIGRL